MQWTGLRLLVDRIDTDAVDCPHLVLFGIEHVVTLLAEADTHKTWTLRRTWVSRGCHAPLSLDTLEYNTQCTSVRSIDVVCFISSIDIYNTITIGYTICSFHLED